MSFYDSIGNVVTGKERLPTLEVGEYEVEIEDVGLCGQKNEYFRVVQKVLSSEGAGATPAGTRTVYLIKGEDKHNYGLKDIIFFIRAITNNPRLEVTKAVVDNLLGNSGAAAGTRMRVSVFVPEGKNPDFPKSRYSFLAAPAKGTSAEAA